MSTVFGTNKNPPPQTTVYSAVTGRRKVVDATTLWRGRAPLADKTVDPLERSADLKLVTVKRVAEARLPTEFAEFRIIGYRSLNSTEEFVVLALGEFSQERPSLVRIHSQCMTGEVFGSTKCDCGRQLRAAMELIAAEGRGAIIYQQQEGRGIGIINKIAAYALQDDGADTIEANELLGLEVDSRRYDQCAEVFLDLGLCRVRVMTNNPLKLRALERHGLEVVERVSLPVEPHADFAKYLRTKNERMGHLAGIGNG